MLPRLFSEDCGKPKYPTKRDCPPKNGYRVPINHSVQSAYKNNIFEGWGILAIHFIKGPPLLNYRRIG